MEISKNLATPVVLKHSIQVSLPSQWWTLSWQNMYQFWWEQYHQIYKWINTVTNHTLRNHGVLSILRLLCCFESWCPIYWMLVNKQNVNFLNTQLPKCEEVENSHMITNLSKGSYYHIKFSGHIHRIYSLCKFSDSGLDLRKHTWNQEYIHLVIPHALINCSLWNQCAWSMKYPVMIFNIYTTSE